MTKLNILYSQLNQLLSKSAPHVVGGAVRDRLLGRPIYDLDLVINTNPELVSSFIADKLGGRWFPLDKERGIARISFPNEAIHVDIAQYQGKTLEEDLNRRDFTINAMAVPLGKWIGKDWKKHVIDNHKGLRHLKKKLISSVSGSVFREDPLRLLRMVRIAAELGFKIENDLERQASKEKRLLSQPAPERIREELLKIFVTERAYSTLQIMDRTGLLDVVFKEAFSLRKTAPSYYGKGGVLKHTLESVQCFEDIQANMNSWFPRLHKKVTAYLNEIQNGYPRYAHCKWGLLLHDIGKPDTAKVIKGRLRFFEHEHVGARKIEKISKRFRWSSDETSRYANYVRHHMRPGNLASHGEVTDKAIHRFFRDLGDEAISMLLVSLADHLTYLTPAQKRRRNSDHETLTIHMIKRYYLQRSRVVPDRLITGHDILNTFGLKPSPLIGIMLNDVKEAQVEGSVTSADEAMAFLRARLDFYLNLNGHQH